MRILEVSDDGCGIPAASRPYIATPHATSKIQTFEDIYNNSSSSSLQTLGFRGEALFCLANLSQKLIVATRTADEAVAQKLEFGKDGTLDPTVPITTFAKKVGTTVAVLGLLEAVPVRRADLQRRLSQHRSRMVQWMEAYAIFSVGRRICVMDMVGKNCREQTILATTFQNSSLRENVSSVLGSNVVTNLFDVQIDLTEILSNRSFETNRITTGDQEEDREAQNNQEPTDSAPIEEKQNDRPVYEVKGLVSKALPISSGAPTSSSPVRQYFSINGRPVELPKLARLVNEVWRTSATSSSAASSKKKNKPFLFLEITLPNRSYDINLSPDKRQVQLSFETEIFNAITKRLIDAWSEQTNGQFVRAAEPTIRSAPAAQQSMSTAALAALHYESPNENDEDENLMARSHSSSGLSQHRRTGLNEDVSPTRFNRRYAFSHDITKMRLQHQFDDGRTKCGDSEDENHSLSDATPEEKRESVFDNYHSKNDAAQTSPKRENPVQGEEDNIDANDLRSEQERRMLRLSFGAKNTTFESDAAMDETDLPFTTPSPAQLNLPLADADLSSKANSMEMVIMNDSGKQEAAEDLFSVSPSSVKSVSGVTSMSPAERRRWRAMQRSFNRANDCFEGIEQEIEMAKCNETSLPISNEKTGRTDDTEKGSEKASEKAYNSQFGLEHFGFRALPPTASMPRDSSRPSEWERIVQLNSKLAPPDPPTKRPRYVSMPQSTLDDREEASAAGKSQELAPPDPPTKRPRHVSIPQSTLDDREEASAAGQSQDAWKPSAMKDTDKRNKLLSAANLCPEEGPRVVPSTHQNEEQTDFQPVVWESFQSTKDVVLAARRERLALRDRKRKLQEQNGASYDSLEKVDDGTTRGNNRIVSLSKEDFLEMTVIGQFNLGFILARSKSNDLWILDQHACDEKFNFEKLCSETIIHEQPLISPMPLELSPAEETCVMDNMEIFEKNGFRFVFDETKPPRTRLSLTALPHSGARDGRKAVQFGKEDVSALCAILGCDDPSGFSEDTFAGGTGTDGSGVYGNNAVRRYANSSGVCDATDKIIARLPKAIAMFASRACRGSIMIGTALSQREMEKIVKRLADVEHPWNCPHGRPTMRHVGNLQGVFLQDEKAAHEQVAGPTVTIVSTQDEVEL